MRPTLLPIMVPLSAGVFAGLLVPMAVWADLTTSLLPCIAVLGAAVFVRLARGLPFNNPDHFVDRGEAKIVSDMILAIARSLQLLIYVVLAAMLLVALSRHIMWFVEWRPLPRLAGFWLGRIYSAAVAILVTFVFVRILQVVRSDISLARKQAEILVSVIDRKEGKVFDASLPPPKDRSIVGAKDFGGLVQ